jgi:REP element-mobilizing transposase RayT
MNRGRDRQKIYHGKVYYQAFIETIAEAHRRFGIEVHAYCLMGNHYHLLVKTPNGNLSRSMRHINGVYTQRYNRLKGTDGPLFRGRFKSILIESDAYLAELTRYIHRNPVETKPPMVKRLEHYEWSSYPAYLNMTASPEWLYREETYALLGYHQRYKGYRTFVELGVDEEIASLYGKKTYPAILGSKKYKEKIYAEVDNRETVTRLKKSETEKPDSQQIVKVVAEVMNVDESVIYYATRGKREVARWMAMRLCQTVGGMTLMQIAQVFHITHISGVSHRISQLRQLQSDERKVDECYQMINQHLTP